jgi:hypothetical protein
MIVDDENFRIFASYLQQAIGRYQKPASEEGLLMKQYQQFKDLVGMEREFRRTLIRSRWGATVYNAYISLICDTNKNILTSRPYFRERQKICIKPIAKALKLRHAQSLYQYDFNYNFVLFAMKTRQWPPDGKLAKLARQISALRDEIVVSNMPLAISQARIFWAKAPMKTQDVRFTFMDFVQISADGLQSAVDKFVLPEGLDENPAKIKVWRAVAIGRMKGNFIEMFSETAIHFFPQDKRKLYRANKHLKDFNGQVDFEALADRVNKDLSEDGLVTNASELANLMGAAANAGNGVGTDEDADPNDAPLERASASADWQPDVRYERAETMHVLKQGIVGLDVMEQKLIRMKGVNVDSI